MSPDERDEARAVLVEEVWLTASRPGLAPGLYLSDPQGHALLVGDVGDERLRSLAILDMGGLIDIGGIQVRDPAILAQLAERFAMLSARLRHEIDHPYHPGVRP